VDGGRMGDDNEYVEEVFVIVSKIHSSDVELET
jgi:hypothetical protein